MGRIDFFLGVFVCLVLCPVRTPGFLFSSASEMFTSGVSGAVFSDGTNERIPQASVTLCDDGGNPLQDSFAGDSGEFSFQGLRPGHYILRVKATGFQPLELHVDLSLTSERGLTVSMKKIPAAVLPPPGGETISAHELAMPESARNLLASGKKKLYTDKDVQAALRDFQSATEKVPTFYEAYYQAGMAQLALQNSVEAEKQFRKAVEISQKKYGDADIALGTLLVHRSEVNEGETLLRKGVAANPNSWPGQFEVAELELSRGHLQPALIAAEKAAQLAPQQAVVYRLLAVIHLRQKDYPALVSALDSYIELDPDSPAGARAKELRVEAQKQLGITAEAAAVAVK
jgi:Carboxypeptidase regulatory-like domain/Tetratricopeptide repeat